jgi:enoyl-CoA hydratase/carnithine racemase
MVFESAHIRVTAEYGTATLWLGFPGEPANALDLARLRELDAALQFLSAHTPNVLVVRSAIPRGFCAGLHPHTLASLTHPTERAAFAWYGQQVFDRLARLDAVSVAFVDGACLGAGLELALACDYRICVARSTTHIGFPDRFACFGGSSRIRGLNRRADLLATGETLSGREARALGLVDVACCERRAKVELRTLLDRLETHPVKPRRAADLAGLAAERRAFAARVDLASRPASLQGKGEQASLRLAEESVRGLPNPLPPFPDVVGLLGDDPNAARLAAEVALRGGSVVVCGNRAGVFAGIDTALARGFVTPLEAEQTRARVRGSDTLAEFDRAGLVFVAPGLDHFRLAAVVRTRAVVCVISAGESRPAPRPPLPFPFPRRLVRVGFCEGNRLALFPDWATDPDTTATLAAWLQPFGLASVVFPIAARLLPRAA